ncbi:phage portal protein [Priestia megaterium]|uniref:phage portal protein n=1 Tax=Priestia megaterium TaxID=1404 RepID=UPI0039E9C031
MGILDRWFSTEKRAMNDIQDTTTVETNQAFSLDSLLNTNAVTEEKVMKIPTAKACVDLITSTIASMPVYLYKEAKDGSIERVNDNRIKLLNHEANDYLNGYNLKKYMAKDFVLHGATYVSIIEAANTILELHPLPARSVVINKKVQDGYRTVGAEIVLSNSESGALNQVSRAPKKFKPYELMIATQESHDGLAGKGVIVYGQDIFNQALSEMEYTSNLYERGALPLGLLKAKSRLNEQQSNALRDAWQKLYGGIRNSAKTVVLQEGMEYQALSMNPNEIQMDATRKNTNSEICKLFGVSESMVNAKQGKQYDSVSKNNEEFLKKTLTPIISAIESAMDRALLLEKEKKKGYFFRFDTTELIRANEKERVETLTAAINGKLLTVNEARNKYDLPSMNDDMLLLSTGDVVLNPKTGEITVPNIEGGDKTKKEDVQSNEQPTEEQSTGTSTD